MFKDRSIPHDGDSGLSSVLQDAQNSGTAMFKESKWSHDIQRKPPWRNPMLLRQAMLPVITLVYFVMISVFLMANSPGQLVAHFVGISPSFQDFVRIYQTALHFSSFYFLTILLCLCYRKANSILIFVILVYATFTELFQILLPDRFSDVSDLLANFAGIGCGIVTVWVFYRSISLITSGVKGALANAHTRNNS